MVSFSCESCNDVIKKPKLDSHRNRCHNAQFTCIDCSKTFSGTEYRSHTSCISEEQKYQGALYKEKKKGPQQNQKEEERKPETKKVEMTDAPAPAAEEKTEKKEKKDKKDKKKEKESKKEKKKDKKPDEEEPATEEAAAETPKKEKKDKESKKDKKRKSEDGAETPAKKSKHAPNAVEAANVFLEQFKAGRPVTLAKALARAKGELEAKGVSQEDVFGVLRFKRGKEGIVVTVAEN